MLAAATVSCSHSAADGPAVLESAELAYANGRYAGAQTLCDSLILSRGFDGLSTEQLCRLSLLFVRLAENHGNEDSNTAFAARALRAASDRSADSTAMFLSNAPVEDQARLALITAINEGLSRPFGCDSTIYYQDTDSSFEAD